MSNSVPLKGEIDKKLGAFFAPLRVEAQDFPNMTVKVRAGSFWTTDNTTIEYAGGTSAPIPLPVGKPRWTLVCLSPAGSLTMTHGAVAGSPSIPTIPADSLPLAAIYVTPSTITITDNVIQDVRPFIRAGQIIPNLTTELANRPTFTDLNSGLVLKADTTGTPEETFTLNSDLTGAATADVTIAVNRGTDPTVGIRFNETSNQWEFTNDGSSWAAIASVSGVFAPIVHTHVSADITDLTSNILSVTSVKADKVIASVTGNFASLDVSGNLLDSGKTATDFVPAAHATDTSLHLTPAQNTFLDGLAGTLTAVELGYVDGVTSPIQTQIDGKSAVGHTHLLAGITDVTATAAEVNYLAGATSSIQAQLNGKSAVGHTHLLAGITDVTATAAEVNVLAGIPVTLTSTELGYVDGVTSSIQTQLNGKAVTASPAFTGVPALPTYTVATLPTGVMGGVIYVSNATRTTNAKGTATGTMAFFDGTSWIDVTTGFAVV
jgi:hypothetical protein